MNYCKKPCDQCPFRNKSASGWLGGFTPLQTQIIALSEQDFQCHKTRETGKEKHCAGRILFAANSFKSFRRNDLETIMDKLIANNQHYKEEILDFKTFIHHHTI